MRTSAISCRCSLSMAAAGAANAIVSATARRDGIVRFISGSFGGDHEMGAAILEPRALVVSRVERKLLAVAHGPQPVGGDAERHEVRARRDRPSFTQRQIVLGCSALVAVPLDGHGPGAVALE